MSARVFTEVEETLLLLAEARERAERAARVVAEDGGSDHAAEALQRIDRELLALHRRLMDEALFQTGQKETATATETQLALDQT